MLIKADTTTAAPDCQSYITALIGIRVVCSQSELRSSKKWLFINICWTRDFLLFLRRTRPDSSKAFALYKSCTYLLT